MILKQKQMTENIKSDICDNDWQWVINTGVDTGYFQKHMLTSYKFPTLQC